MHLNSYAIHLFTLQLNGSKHINKGVEVSNNKRRRGDFNNKRKRTEKTNHVEDERVEGTTNKFVMVP